jgi:hypothetical protein
LKTNNTIDSIQQEDEMSETKIDMDDSNGIIIFYINYNYSLKPFSGHRKKIKQKKK